jgi:hypothetical protein
MYMAACFDMLVSVLATSVNIAMCVYVHLKCMHISSMTVNSHSLHEHGLQQSPFI